MRKPVFIVALFLLIISFVFPAFTVADEVPWTAYFGTHYRDVPWARSVRDPVSPGIAGYWPDAGTRRGNLANRYNDLVVDLQKRLRTQDVVLGVGGLGSGRRAEEVDAFMNMVQADSAGRWKEELYKRVERIARIKGARERVYWQFGNEINGPRFLRNMIEWQGGDTRQRDSVMSDFIPLYVEYFLAPGIEAINKASRDVYGREGQIRIMLGSLANARHPRSLPWYHQLLEYEINGQYASSLRGKRVYQLVDTLSIHYLLTAPDDYWAEELDKLSRSYMGRGAVRRIFSTEEIGIKRAKKGHGAATALQVWARSLWWWEKYLWKPYHGRVFFWGWNIGDAGSRVEDSLNAIYQFTGDKALRYSGKLAGDAASESAESYAFEIAGQPGKRVAIVFPRGRGASVSINSLVLPQWQGTGNISVIMYSPQGAQRLQVSTNNVKGSLLVDFRKDVQLQSGSALLMLLGR